MNVSKEKSLKSRMAIITLTAAAAMTYFLFASHLPARAARKSDKISDMNFWRMARETNTLPGARRTPSPQRFGVSVKLNLVKLQYTGNGQTWIFNMDTRRFWLLQYRSQTFSEDSFDKLADYFYAQNLDERVRLESEKKRIEANGQQAGSGLAKDVSNRLAFLDIGSKKLRVKAAGGEAVTIVGYPAKPVEVSMDGDVVETIWVSDELTAPEGWIRFLKLMSEIDPVRWKAEASVEKMALKGESSYGGVQSTWETQNLAVGMVSINEFLIPPNFAPEPFPPK